MIRPDNNLITRLKARYGETQRANILKGFLARENLYFTEICRDMWEAKACANLERSIAKLEAHC